MNNILMNEDMTKAILDGRKVQTRRVIKLDTKRFRFDCIDEDLVSGYQTAFFYDKEIDEYEGNKLKYQIDDVLWVREPAKITRCDDILRQYDYQYLSDGFNKWQQDIPKRIQFKHTNAFIYPDKYGTWLTNCQGIPNGCIKEMARIFLKVTNVRVERLWDITLDNVAKEGCPFDKKYEEPEMLFEWWEKLWNSTAPKGYKYLDNPYVFCYTFEVIDKKDI
jgi:hypothetical protein